MMPLPVKFFRAAEIEAAEAIDWYEERESGLGAAFRESVDRRSPRSSEIHLRIR